MFKDKVHYGMSWTNTNYGTKETRKLKNEIFQKVIKPAIKYLIEFVHLWKEFAFMFRKYEV